MNRDSRDFITEQFALAGVDSDPKLEPEGVHGVTDGDGAADRARRSIEGGKEAVAGRVDLVPAESLELTSHDRAVACEQVRPSVITHCTDSLSRLDDVSDQDGGEHAVRLWRR